MKFFRSKEIPNPNRLAMNISGDLLVITGRHATRLGTHEYEILISSFDWYDTGLADPYRELRLEELPVLSVPEGFQNMWPNSTQWSITIRDEDTESLDRLLNHASVESLTQDQMAVKALTCNLFSLEAEHIRAEDVAPERNKNGFTRAEPKQPPLGDPRDIGH